MWHNSDNRRRTYADVSGADSHKVFDWGSMTHIPTHTRACRIRRGHRKKLRSHSKDLDNSNLAQGSSSPDRPHHSLHSRSSHPHSRN
ncbi:hypothetical protein [Bythopirellula polymerisocia]|uniref:hypothetical protein n=1 Tax=Bythopirellula polymerisocia TaxID=2528003 RepID=UPI0011B7EB6E|nr:hypothetical protein [Bythopirellula polymerisocia]